MKLCVGHSYMSLVHFRPSLQIFTKVNSNFTNRTALSGPSRPKLAILCSKHRHWCTKVHIVQIRRLSVSKQYAKIRIELSVHTAANGFRKDVKCGETQISVRFRGKITLLVNKLTFGVFGARWGWWCTRACLADTFLLVLAWESGSRGNCCSLWWKLIRKVENFQMACGSGTYKVLAKNLSSVLF